MGITGLLSLSLIAGAAPATPSQRPDDDITHIRYDVFYDSETALRREIHVEMSFDQPGDVAVALSLPAWTPGSYELDDFAKNVRNVWARQDGEEVRWDKADFDTWRVYPLGEGRVTIGFDYLADRLDIGSAWARSDFAFFNGTNLFLFPDGSDLTFPSDVTVHTEEGWLVTTGMTAGARPREYTANSYHELVDMPTFVGRFDVDSMRIDGKWYRLATYPEGTMAGAVRETFWDQIQRMMPPMVAVTDDVPWDSYTTFQVFDSGFGGGSALEHSNSHLGVYTPALRDSPTLALVTAHEIFHAWNVKRLRPADLWPYDYSRRMPTELLWISEGVTDYYADLALVRGGVVPAEYFYRQTRDKIDEVRDAPPASLEDASVSTWISPRDGTSFIYYSKGSLAGLMLDILIRDASDNARSLDDVIKALYEDAYLQGRGFTQEDWWSAVREAAGGRSFEDFSDAYVDGREPYPWADILPLAGLRLRTETEHVPRIGLSTAGDAQGVRVVDVVGGSAASAAGVRVGDRLISVGGIAVEDQGFGGSFRARFADEPEGTPYTIVVDRSGRDLTLEAELRFAELTSSQLEEDDGAGAKARRIRAGILSGSTGR